MTVHLLVSSYAEERIGERLSDSRHPSLEEAQACGETLRAKGVCVIVLRRPFLLDMREIYYLR